MPVAWLLREVEIDVAACVADRHDDAARLACLIPRRAPERSAGPRHPVGALAAVDVRRVVFLVDRLRDPPGREDRLWEPEREPALGVGLGHVRLQLVVVERDDALERRAL